MILPQDIFETTREYVEFILYLHSAKVFTIEQLSLKFNISKWLLYKRVKYWENQGYITVISTVGEKGGKHYHYRITESLDVILDKLLSVLRNRLD